MKSITSNSGSPLPLGCSISGNAVNFSLFAAHSESVKLGLFQPGSKTPDHIFPLLKTGNHWHIALSPIPTGFLYGYQCDNNPDWLLDPYAKLIDADPIWKHPREVPLLASLNPIPPFDWEGSQHPNIAKQDLVIYEMHVRGFTIHPSSGTKSAGTYAGMIEKIPYLKKLGINAVEFMPIFEFDETDTKCVSPTTQEKLPNYWGYDPISYFSPKASYAANHALGGALFEFKTLVKELHKQGIEVILDVVYNHTGKSSLLGIDKKTYYMLDDTGKNRDYSGCGNTVNTNQPAVQDLIMASLRYWVEECRVDGFRFDLASILTRATDGHPLDPAPLMQAIRKDPLLSKRKLIAEAWDAVGLYQLGSFPKWGPWSEWNGRYRDVIRRFIKGNNDKAGLFANALCGSDFLYHSLSPLASVNFVTAHDGFCLRDLVTYQSKYNEANGEKNQDGSTHNDSWNCGAEGPTKDPHILELRERQMRNFWLSLLLSQGIPMILMGDEYGHTRHGNNNPYVQDNEINWFLWDELQKNTPIFQFVQKLIAFRQRYPELHQTHFLPAEALDWHGHKVLQPDWSPTSRFIAFSTKEPCKLYIAFNADYLATDVELPPNTTWQTVINTQYGWDQQWFDKPGPILGRTIHLPAHTALVAIQHSDNQ